MTSVKKILMAATALTLMSGTAYAQSNEAYIYQPGDDNSAVVRQDQGSDNHAGTFAAPLTQWGNDNRIQIDQTGAGNIVGDAHPNTTSGGTPYGVGKGVDQRKNYNVLIIGQSGDGNKVREVQQEGRVAGRKTSNRVNITQSSNRNVVSNIDQNFTGDRNDGENKINITQEGGNLNYVGHNSVANNSGWGAFQTGTENSLTLVQNGTFNQIKEVVQNNRNAAGGTNTATVRQIGGGERNYVHLVNQTNTGRSDNTISMSFTGSFNGASAGGGRGAFTGELAGSAFEQATAIQRGEGHRLSYNVTGNLNLFAFEQYGSDNTIRGTVTSDSNQAAIYQNGSDNIATFNQATGGSTTNIRQTGMGNTSNVSQ